MEDDSIVITHIGFSKYLLQTLATVQPMAIVTGYIAGLLLDLNDEKYFICMLIFISAGLILGLVASLKNYKKYVKPLYLLGQIATKRTQAISNLLNNAGQGFLSFGSDLLIHDEYSTECTRIFTQEIRGLKFSQLISPDDDEQELFIGNLLIKALNNRDPLVREIYLPLLPTEVAIGNRVVNIEYKLIDPKNEIASYCMVILTDITDNRTLETQIEQERNLLKMVVKVVLSYADFNQNVRDYTYYCETRLPEILDNKAAITDKVAEVFRTIHTFKGSFSQLGMKHIVDKLHDFETQIADLKKNLAIREWQLQEVKEFFAQFTPLSWMEKDLEGLQDVLGQDFFSQDDELIISKNKLIEIEKKIEMILTPAECKILIPEIRKLRYKPFDQLLKSYPEYVTNLAEKLEKSVYPVNIQADTILVNPDQFNEFTKSLVHVFRNAVDHGLESGDERVENGKEEFGKIQCFISETEKQICLTITDDGRGINTLNLRNKAVERGLRTREEVSLLTDEEAIQLIFAEGLSTSDDVNDLSGRGVGLAAVLYELTKLGGTLTVKTELGQGSEFRFYLPKETEEDWEVTISELMRPLVDTTSRFIQEQANMKVTCGQHYEVEELEKIELNKVSVIINIRGALEFVVILSFDEPVLRTVVRHFILEEITLEEETAYMEDVLSEVANTIIGNSLQEFPGLEERLSIEPPMSLSSEDALVKYNNSQIWVCKMQTELGNLSLGLVIPQDELITAGRIFDDNQYDLSNLI